MFCYTLMYMYIHVHVHGFGVVHVIHVYSLYQLLCALYAINSCCSFLPLPLMYMYGMLHSGCF